MARRRGSVQRSPHRLPDPPLFRLPPLDLRLYEDRRTYHPSAFPPVGVIDNRAARRLVERLPVRPVSPYRDPFPSLRLGFAVPQRVALCVRRKTRREVIFAKGLRRAGSGARTRRRNEHSDVRC